LHFQTAAHLRLGRACGVDTFLLSASIAGVRAAREAALGRWAYLDSSQLTGEERSAARHQERPVEEDYPSIHARTAVGV
jgi:hypothetical protein